MPGKTKKYNYRSLIRSAARKIWMWSPMRREAIKNARVAKGTVACANCSKWMKENPDKNKGQEKEYKVDHVIPASEPAALIHDWNDFFERLNVPANPGLQILCDDCHDTKTKVENAQRVKTRTKRKIKRKHSKE